jgi:serine/threonine-protein kinase
VIKVLDFGIAKLSAERYLEGGPSALLTESGSMLGTPCYMAPQQASGEHPVDHRADIWSLGVILYECLSGVRPIEGESLPQVVARLMSAGIMPLERIAPELPPEVTSLVKQMLSRDVARRTQSLMDVIKTLSRYTNVKAPDFGAPSTGRGLAQATPKTMESARPKTKVVASRDADPQGPTMLSSPPVNSSVQLQQPPVRRGRGAYVLGAAVLVVALGGWVWGATRLGPAAQRVEGELPTLSAAPLKSLPPAEPAAATAPSAAAAAVSSSPQPAVVSSSPQPAVRKVTTARPKTRPQPAPGGAKPRADSSDETLFSGRK